VGEQLVHQRSEKNYFVQNLISDWHLQ
jgi:hypothetical protein